VAEADEPTETNDAAEEAVHEDASPAAPRAEDPDTGTDTDTDTDDASTDAAFDAAFGIGEDRDLDFGEDRPPAANAVRIAQIGLVVLVLLVVGMVIVSKSGSDDDKKASGDGTEQATGNGEGANDGKAAKPVWPPAVGGRPAGLGETKVPATEVTVEAEPGVYLWNDFDGWHLWVVNGAGVPPVSGSLSSNDELGKAVLAVPDAGTVKQDGKTATFILPTDVPLTGIDFNPGFYSDSIVIALNGPDGAPVDTALVKTGKKSTAAPFPIVIRKA